jgi:hypothetical protein
MFLHKIFRTREGWFIGWRVVLFVLATICLYNQAICATTGRRTLNAQDTADINVLLPGLLIPGNGLWVMTRSNPPKRNPTQTLQKHYESGHAGILASDTRTLPFFNGVSVAPVTGLNPATAEEVVMANFIATLIPHAMPGAPSHVPILPGAIVEVKPKSYSREIRIPVPTGSIQIQEERAPTPVDAKFCSIFLPAVPAGVPPGTLAPPPANVCTLYFRQ